MQCFWGVDLNEKLGVTEDMICFFTGIGSGLAGGSAVMLIKTMFFLICLCLFVYCISYRIMSKKY